MTLNTISMVSPATGSGPCAQRTIGDIIFEIPLVHGHHPFHNVPIETTSPGDEPRLTTRIHELAKDLSDTLKAATASGEFDQTWAMVERMSFHDAMEVLLQAPNSSSD